MYDVKQADPAEWSLSLLFEVAPGQARLGEGLDRPGRGQPEGSGGFFSQPCMRIRAGRSFQRIWCLWRKENKNRHALPASRSPSRGISCSAQVHRGVYMPSAEQDRDGKNTMTLGAKGVIELELVSSGEKWDGSAQRCPLQPEGRPLQCPAWHLVEALVTLVSPDGSTPRLTVLRIRPVPSPPPKRRRSRILAASTRRTVQEAVQHRNTGSTTYQSSGGAGTVDPAPNREYRRTGGRSTPGRGGKTILPHRAVAKSHLRRR